jgi:ribonuclease D
MSDDVLVELARFMPTNWQRLERVRGLKPDARQRYGKLLLEIIKAARSEPPENWPWLPTHERLQPTQEALVDAMMAVIRLRCLQNTVDSHILANRKDVERLLRGALDIPLLHGWRGALVGHELQALLRGELCLKAYKGELHIAPTKIVDCYAGKPE